MVAVVVGESYEACRAAAMRVEVEYEALPAVIGIDDAIAADSWHTAGHRIRRGDPEAAIAAAPRSLEGVVTIGGQEHFYLETHAAWAERTDDGGVRVVSSTQHPSEIQAVVSHVLHLPRASVTVESPRMGGGFGGKETQGNAFAALCALAAWRTGRPTRVMLDRDLDMALTGKRHPFRADFRVGFDEAGRLLGLTATLVSDGGWALDLSESINDRALFHLDNAYYLPAMEVFGRVAKTHVVSHTAFRGFGAPQGMLVIEDVLDRVARALDLPPELVRERNFYRGDGETSTTHYGERVEDNRTARIWDELLASSDYAARRAAVDAWNARHPMVKRGLAITPVKFGISVHGHLPQPGGRAGARLPRRLGAGEPRRHRDGPGPLHEDPGRRDARARRAGVARPHDEDPDRQGAQHLRHRGLVGHRPQRRGGAPTPASRSASASSPWPRRCCRPPPRRSSSLRAAGRFTAADGGGR